MSAEPDPLPSPSLRRRLHMRVEERLEGRSCGWCSVFVAYSGRGRPPSYCSKSCRNRAWEVRTAEARLQRDIVAGTARSEPVREVIRQTVVQTRPAPPPAEQSAPAVSTAAGWMTLLQELTEQLREGELGRQHWHHEKLYRRLTEVAATLGEAYPGGMGHLQRNAGRRSR
ncbi:hypothetical protein [Streptosporangium sp. OZ121]|uniref:hypothetical protein n=1 Tax=Streptosporangium sp. OZ121 TaxID=3444183 RepID=UPI003F7A3EBF